MSIENSPYAPILRDFAEKVEKAAANLISVVGPLSFVFWMIGTDEIESKAVKGAAARFIAAIEKAEIDVPELHKTYLEKHTAFSEARDSAIALRNVILGFWNVSGDNLEMTEEEFKEIVGLADLEKALASIPTKGRKQNGATVTVKSEASKIREWAKANGYEIGDRGVISEDIKDAYAKAFPNS